MVWSVFVHFNIKIISVRTYISAVCMILGTEWNIHADIIILSNTGTIFNNDCCCRSSYRKDKLMRTWQQFSRAKNNMEFFGLIYCFTWNFTSFGLIWATHSKNESVILFCTIHMMHSILNYLHSFILYVSYGTNRTIHCIEKIIAEIGQFRYRYRF